MTDSNLLTALATSNMGVHWFWMISWLTVVSFLFVAAVALTISRWGRSQPVRICVVLSLLAHVLLAGYAATVRIASAAPAGADTTMEISLADFDDLRAERRNDEKPWEQFPTAQLPEPEQMALAPQRLPDDLMERVTADLQPTGARGQGLPSVNPMALAQVQPYTRKVARKAEQLDVPEAQSESSQSVLPADAALERPQDPPSDTSDNGPADRALARSVPELPDELSDVVPAEAASPGGGVARRVERAAPAAPLPKIAGAPEDPGASPGPNTDAAKGSDTSLSFRDAIKQGTGDVAPAKVPDVYRLRVSPKRNEISRKLGSNPKTEQAVKSGLKWLAAAQSDDGRWDASRWGAGRTAPVVGQDRQQAGANADMATTGLAVLAFLGGGHTHLEDGPYQETVREGLEFLMSQQRRDGSLAGRARLFAAMYCHGIATFAVSEAYAMTADRRLRATVVRAVDYTAAAQDRNTGGWRYQPGDAGDTSQLGWQAMALKSAELAGIPIPERTREGMQRFLTTVSSGPRGGLAGYRPGQAISYAMTAEALAVRHFLGMSPRHPTATEGADFLMGRLPGTEVAGGRAVNLYYWYYAALALYQRQDQRWTRWNKAMQAMLVENQQRDGSWSSNTVWGPHGGRVYTTAMATLCLEVYYRFLPLYAEEAGK